MSQELRRSPLKTYLCKRKLEQDFEQAPELPLNDLPKSCISKYALKIEKHESQLSPDDSEESSPLNILTDSSNASAYDDDVEEDIDNDDDDDDQELSLIRPHLSDIDSECKESMTSDSLTVTYVWTSATDSHDEEELPSMEIPRQSLHSSELERQQTLSDLLIQELVNNKEKKEEISSPELPDDLCDASFNCDNMNRIRCSTPVKDSQFQVPLFDDSFSTISDNEKVTGSSSDIRQVALTLSPRNGQHQVSMNMVVEDDDIRAEIEEEDEEVVEEDAEEEDEEEMLSLANINETTPPRTSEKNLCPWISRKHSLKVSVNPRGKTIRSSRCIFPEEVVDREITFCKTEETLTANQKCFDPLFGIMQLTNSTMVLHEKNKQTGTRKCNKSHSALVKFEDGGREIGVPSAASNQETSETQHDLSVITLSPTVKARQTETARCIRKCNQQDTEEEILFENSFSLPPLHPYLVGKDTWNVPYRKADGQICEFEHVNVCSLIRSSFMEEKPVLIMQYPCPKSTKRSYSPDFLESF